MCASIWAGLQCMAAYRGLDTTWPLMRTSKSMSRPQSSDSVRYGSSSVPRDGGRILACSSAASGTTQGDTVVANDLARNGPSGTDSQDCRSRADQSLTRHAPNTCSVNLVAGTGSLRMLCAPTTKPSSASKSSRTDGPNDGMLAPGGLDWPHGRRIGVCDTTTV